MRRKRPLTSNTGKGVRGLTDMDEPPHPLMPHVLKLTLKAHELQERANSSPEAVAVRFALRAELVRESRRRALAEVMGGGGG